MRHLWHSRGYLPHFESPGASQFITFRLGDSLPAEFVRARLRPPEGETEAERIQRLLAVEEELDASRGECHLRRPEIAGVVEQELLDFDGTRYRLLAWVVMPNHVHVAVELKFPWTLTKIVHTWKTRTAWVANRILGRRGRFWQPDYFDRRIRDEEHLGRCIRYIEANPFVAGLCKSPAAWPFSSARRR